MNNWTEILAIWNGKMADLTAKDAFFFRALRWFFASFLLFAIIMFTGLYHLLSIAHPVVGK